MSQVKRASTLAQRATQIREAQNNPFGEMTADEALVLLHGLETQNIEDLMAVKEAYPDVWEEHKQKTKQGKWVFSREMYGKLKELATGTPAVSTMANEL